MKKQTLNRKPSSQVIKDSSEESIQKTIREVMITTSDNPYNPFTDWDSWLAFDSRSNYNTSLLLASLIDEEFISFNLGPDLVRIEDAIDVLVSTRPDGFYKKLVLTKNLTNNSY